MHSIGYVFNRASISVRLGQKKLLPAETRRVNELRMLAVQKCGAWYQLNLKDEMCFPRKQP